MTRNEIRDLIAAGAISEIGAERYCRTENGVHVPLIGATRLRIEYYQNEVDTEFVIDAVHNLTNLREPDRQLLLAPIFSAYLESVEDCSADFGTAQAQLDWEAASAGNFEKPVVPKAATDIWSLVKFFAINVSTSNASGQTIASIRGDTAWDGEHGIALFFEEGRRFLKVGNLNDSIR